MNSFVKDPDATLDWKFDWTDWLASNETVTTHTIETDGLTVDTSTEDSGTVTVWLSGGTNGETVNVTCRITTDQGRTDDRTVRIAIRER